MVEIPKPNEVIRKIRILTVVDRLIEQAIIKLLEYYDDGYVWKVDIDLEKLFDNVPQYKLMSYVGKVMHDGDTDNLIRKYLKAGVMNNGVYNLTKFGIPQRMD